VSPRRASPKTKPWALMTLLTKVRSDSRKAHRRPEGNGFQVAYLRKLSPRTEAKRQFQYFVTTIKMLM
jgi:hypothetical protein